MVAAWASSGGWSDLRGWAVMPLVGVGRPAEEVVERRTGVAAAAGGPLVDQRGGEVVPRMASGGRGPEGRVGLEPYIVCLLCDVRDVGFVGLGPYAAARDERRRGTMMPSDVLLGSRDC